MKFTGIGKIFSTECDNQYVTIGEFWDNLSAVYGRENLRGLGYNWTKNSIEYVIGLKKGSIENENTVVELPDSGWTFVEGKTEDLGKIYEEIYKDGNLTYEIESFDDNGNCRIQYYRK